MSAELLEKIKKSFSQALSDIDPDETPGNREQLESSYKWAISLVDSMLRSEKVSGSHFWLLVGELNAQYELELVKSLERYQGHYIEQDNIEVAL